MHKKEILENVSGNLKRTTIRNNKGLIVCRYFFSISDGKKHISRYYKSISFSPHKIDIEINVRNSTKNTKKIYFDEWMISDDGKNTIDGIEREMRRSLSNMESLKKGKCGLFYVVNDER